MSSKPRPLASGSLDVSIRLLGRRERSEPGLQADEARRTVKPSNPKARGAVDERRD